MVIIIIFAMYLSKAWDVGSTAMLDIITFISVSDRVAAERWCAGSFCVLLSHHLCGFCISYAVLGGQLGFPMPPHLHMTSRASFRNAGHHSWYQSRVQRSAMLS